MFINLAHLVKWVDTPLQYRGTMTTEEIKIRVKDFERALEVSHGCCITLNTLADKTQLGINNFPCLHEACDSSQILHVSCNLIICSMYICMQSLCFGLWHFTTNFFTKSWLARVLLTYVRSSMILCKILVRKVTGYCVLYTELCGICVYSYE